MKKLTVFVSNYKIMLILGLIGIYSYIEAILFNKDLVEFIIEFLNEFDEIILIVVLLIFGFFIDHIFLERKRQQEAKLHKKRIILLKATLITVQEILTSLLDQFKNLKSKINSQNFDTEFLHSLDSVYMETMNKLKILRNFRTDRQEMESGFESIDKAVNDFNKSA